MLYDPYNFKSWLRLSRLAIMNDIKTWKGVLDRAGINNDFKHILDFGCGMGRSTFALAEIFPNSTIHGVDLDKLSIEEAQKNPKLGSASFPLKYYF